MIPGGLVDKGETLEQAAVREMKEETGISRLVRFAGKSGRQLRARMSRKRPKVLPTSPAALATPGSLAPQPTMHRATPIRHRWRESKCNGPESRYFKVNG